MLCRSESFAKSFARLYSWRPKPHSCCHLADGTDPILGQHNKRKVAQSKYEYACKFKIWAHLLV